MDLFEEASRAKLRFGTTRGIISTEDLWELKLEDLDTIAKDLNRKLKAAGEESFIKKKSDASTLVNLQFELVKHIITVRLEEKEKKALAAERAAKRAQLLELIGDKEMNALKEKSIEELKAELAGLD